MPRTDGGRRKSQIHFEQVPLEVVREIAEIDDADEKTSGTAGSTVERPPDKVVKSGRVPTRSTARKK